jgi:predicted lactoylglutathione lyase
MHSPVFLNMPVSNLETSTKFFTELGFSINERFNGNGSACFIINDQLNLMLSEVNKFAAISPKPIADKSTSEAIFSLACASKEEVSAIAEKAFAQGARKVNEFEDHGFMVSWGFEDLDGHLWDLFWMNPDNK